MKKNNETLSTCIAFVSVLLSSLGTVPATLAATTRVQPTTLSQTSVQPLTRRLGPGVTIGTLLASKHHKKETSSGNSHVSPAATTPQPAVSSMTTFPGFKSWINPNVSPVAAMLCIHGLGLNSGAYDDFGTRMSNKGVLVYAFDMHGFGEWTKLKNGDSLDFEQSLADIKQALTQIRNEHPGLPVFLLGESMGGAIVLRACSEYPALIDGLISSAPGGERYKQRLTNLEVGVHLLTRPRKQFDIGTDIVDQATKNEGLRKLWQSDPLSRLDLSAVQLLKFQVFMNKSDDDVKKINATPVLFLQGTLDRLVKPDDTFDVFNKISSVRKTFFGLRSEHLVIEYGRAKTDAYNVKITTMISNWMKDALSPGTEEYGTDTPSD